MMNLSFTFEYPHSEWSPINVFKRYYDWYVSVTDEKAQYVNSSNFDKSNPSGIYSPHIMTIRNINTKKYFIVSYWDRAVELTWDGNGWDNQNCINIITSSGIHTPMNHIPFSYTTYSLSHEKYINENIISFEDKKNDKLFFRGFLYAWRKEMSTLFPEYFYEDRKPIYDYMEEINKSKICLSLDGAAEICNRDMEILGTGSVLLRPILHQTFYSPLIPDYHYLSVDKVQNPKDQFILLKKKYDEIKDNNELLNQISKNGLKWYNENATVNSNVEILKKIIDLNKLK